MTDAEIAERAGLSVPMLLEMRRVREALFREMSRLSFRKNRLSWGFSWLVRDMRAPMLMLVLETEFGLYVTRAATWRLITDAHFDAVTATVSIMERDLANRPQRRTALV